jgi:predicted Mrr-cat superfamily restriction endonuclease
MRARDRDLPRGAGAALGVAKGFVGIGDALAETPDTLVQAIEAASAEHGEKAGRMLRGFARLPVGTLVWTRSPDGAFHLGRIQGSWRYDDGPEARTIGIHHTRRTQWIDEAFGPERVPPAVRTAFVRGGRNLQRINDEHAEQRSVELWRTSET